MKTVAILFSAALLLVSAPVFSEPGREEIAEMRAVMQDRRAELGKAADLAKSRAATNTDEALAELRRISSELDALDSKERKFRRLEELIAEGIGCVSGRCVTGQGKYVSKTGAFYEGHFLHEKRHGTGTYARPDGTYFSGEWVENRLEGACESGEDSVEKRSGVCSYSSDGNLQFSPLKKVEDTLSIKPFETIGPLSSGNSRPNSESDAPPKEPPTPSVSDSPKRAFLNALAIAVGIAFLSVVAYQLHKRTEFFPYAGKFIAIAIGYAVIAIIVILTLLGKLILWLLEQWPSSPEPPPLERHRGTFGVPPSQPSGQRPDASGQRRRNSGLNPNHVTARGVSASGDVPDSFH